VFPYQADVSMQRWPLANWAVIAVTVVLSVAARSLPGEVYLQLAHWTGNPAAAAERINAQAGTPVIDPNTLKEYGFHAWQLVTSAFLHGGTWHLLGNMIFLFVFGNAVNAKIGHLPYLGLYLAYAAVTGAAWHLSPGNGLLCIGASGAIMGVAGMFAVLYPLNDISIFTFLLYRPAVFRLSAVWVLLGYFILDLLGFLGPSDGISHVSHLSGMLSGTAVTAAAVGFGIIRPRRGEKTLLEILGTKVKREEPYERPGSKPVYVTTVQPPQMRPSSGTTAKPETASGQPAVPERRGAESPPDDLPPIELEP